LAYRQPVSHRCGAEQWIKHAVGLVIDIGAAKRIIGIAPGLDDAVPKNFAFGFDLDGCGGRGGLPCPFSVSMTRSAVPSESGLWMSISVGAFGFGFNSVGSWPSSLIRR